MLEQFNPKMQIVAVDADNALITFDSAAEYDMERSPIAMRVARNFSEIKLHVADVVDVPDGDRDSKRAFRTKLKLSVKSGNGELREHDLATFHLQISALSKPKRGAPATDFPTAAAVTNAVRQGVASALAEALNDFASREGELALGHHIASAPYPTALGATGNLKATAARMPSMAQSLLKGRGAANEADLDRKKFRKQMITAAIVTPLIVIGAMWAISSKPVPADPIQDAVAQAMIQSPAAAQAQVELTKETLKQMGLDPGAAGDTGCLAAQ